MKKTTFFTLLLTAALIAHSASVTLMWDPPNPATNVAGYKIYIGGASRSYTNSYDAGARLTFTVTNLVAGNTYYFAATSYSTNQLESEFSNEVFITIPTKPNKPQSLRIQTVVP